MKPVEEIRQMFENSGGMLRTKELYAGKVFYSDIQQLIKNAHIEKIRYGYYQWFDEDNPAKLD